MMIKANKKIRQRSGRAEERGRRISAQGGVYREGLTRESFETRPGRCKRVNPADIMGWREFPSRGNSKGKHMRFCLKRCLNYLLVPFGFL